MTKEQEARILSNQAIIMQALKILLAAHLSGGGYLSNELSVRITDTDEFIRTYLR